VRAPNEEKCDYSKDRFYEEMRQAFDHFPKYRMKILLGDFNAKLGKDDIFKPTNKKESLHQDSNNNGVRIVNCATTKKIYLLTAQCSRTEIFTNSPGLLLMERLTTIVITY
jgi:exonuclease III